MKAFAALAAAVRARFDATKHHVLATLRRDGYDWRETLSRARARALLIHGTEDAVPVSEAHARGIVHRKRIGDGGQTGGFGRRQRAGFGDARLGAQGLKPGNLYAHSAGD